MKPKSTALLVTLLLALTLLLSACDLDVPTTTPPPATTPPPTTPPPATTPLSCATPPTGSFLAIWESDPALQTALGCPTSNHPRITPEAWEVNTGIQPFETGVMLWSDHIGWYEQPVVYVIYADNTYQRFDDTFNAASDPINGGETPPAGLLEPSYGFGKVWRNEAGVRAALGWAAAPENNGPGRFQLFTGGDMIYLSQTGDTYIFTSGRVLVFNVPFTQ